MIRKNPAAKSQLIATALLIGHKHHFFGYYGINPWNLSIQHHLAPETDLIHRSLSIEKDLKINWLDD